jgi:signal transduction histidine kinase
LATGTAGGDLLAQLIGPGLAVLAVIGPLIFLVIARAYGTIKCLRDGHHQLQALALSLASARDESDAHASAELELRRQAESAYQAKSDFLALISHELRTPLNAIIGFSEILRATGRSPSRHSEENIKYLDYIHQNGEHLLSLINDMIDLTRIESGRYQPRDKCAPLHGVLERCVMLLRQEALDSGIDVSCAATTVIVRADQQAMKQMIVSLLSNAIKFTGRGGNVRIMVDLNDDWLEIRVCDTGIGMTEADLQRAQAPFGQASRTMIRSTGGTGLGLNIARALAKAHGGDLELQSEHGVGTVAFLRLPRIRVSPTLDDPTPLQSTPI